MNEQNHNQVRELTKDEMEQVQGGLSMLPNNRHCSLDVAPFVAMVDSLDIQALAPVCGISELEPGGAGAIELK